MTSTTLRFGQLPSDQAAPTATEIRSECIAHPGLWTVAYVADRLARAQTYCDAVNAGTKLGLGMYAQLRKIGAEHRVYVTHLPKS